MNQINVKVNKQILPVTDKDKYGEIDVWEIPGDNIGDCEEYMLVKRMLLKQAGFPHRAMRITIVVNEEGEGHAVLMVRTDKGDFILDNRIDDIKTEGERTDYAFIKREDENGNWVWMKNFLGM